MDGCFDHHQEVSDVFSCLLHSCSHLHFLVSCLSWSLSLERENYNSTLLLAASHTTTQLGTSQSKTDLCTPFASLPCPHGGRGIGGGYSIPSSYVAWVWVAMCLHWLPCVFTTIVRLSKLFLQHVISMTLMYYVFLYHTTALTTLAARFV